MYVEQMEELLIEIYNIKNLEYINLYDILSTENTKMLVIPAILINYDGGKTLNLCAKDKYFDIYVKKIVEVYNDEKNNVREDILTDPFGYRRNIEIDERTKHILDSGKLEEINKVYQFYFGKKSYEDSLMFQIDEVKSLLPVIKYHVKELFSLTDRYVIFDDKFSGYRDNYMLSGTINGINSNFILHFEKLDENTYNVALSGLMEKNVKLFMKISFSKDSISIESLVDDYELQSDSLYYVVGDIVKRVHEIKIKDRVISYSNEDLECVCNEYDNIANLDNEVNLKWFKLPWGALYGIACKIEEVSELEKVIERHNMYISVFNNEFLRKEYYSRTYLRNRTATVTSNEFILDEVRKNMIGVVLDKINGIYVVETSFDDNVSKTGFYDEKLAKKYFYHVVQSNNGVANIKNENLIDVSKDDGILSNVDLLNKANVLRLVKGE